MRPLHGRATCSNGATLGLKAPDRRAVDDFHRAGLASGGKDAGQPGPRGAGHHAYGAYLLDPDGKKLCAYCFDPS